MSNTEIIVVKRDGSEEEVSFDKILQRIKKLGTEKKLSINYVPLAIKVIEQMYNGISTSKLDELTAEQCASMSALHYDYSILASSILISNLHKNTSSSFYETIKKMYFNKTNDVPNPLVSEKLWDAINTPSFQNIDSILNQLPTTVEVGLNTNPVYLIEKTYGAG